MKKYWRAIAHYGVILGSAVIIYAPGLVTTVAARLKEAEKKVKERE